MARRWVLRAAAPGMENNGNHWRPTSYGRRTASRGFEPSQREIGKSRGVQAGKLEKIVLPWLVWGYSETAGEMVRSLGSWKYKSGAQWERVEVPKSDLSYSQNWRGFTNRSVVTRLRSWKQELYLNHLWQEYHRREALVIVAFFSGGIWLWCLGTGDVHLMRLLSTSV